MFLEIKDNVLPLMRDMYGNYVIQKFFEYGDQPKKTFLFERMKGKIPELSKQRYACRVVQKVSQQNLQQSKSSTNNSLGSEVHPVGATRGYSCRTRQTRLGDDVS